MSDKLLVGEKTVTFDQNEPYLPITQVTVVAGTDGEGRELVFIAGDTTAGRNMEVQLPWGTPEIAESILQSVKGFEYKPFYASGAGIDPAVEPGDGVTIAGVYSMVGNITMAPSGLCEIDTPGQDEIESEIPYKSSSTKAIERIVSDLKTSFVVKIGEITSSIEDTNGALSQISQKLDSITLSVSNGDTSSTISLKAGEAVISSQNITFSGFVTFTGLSGGTTTIDGACIKTGTIDAERLNLTGAITFTDLNTDTQDKIDTAGSSAFQAINLANSALNTANQANRIAESAQSFVDAWTYEGTTYIDGTQLMTGTVTASALRGGTLSILDSTGSVAAYFYPTGASSFPGRKLQIDSGALSISASSGAVYLESSNDAFLTLGGEYRLASFGCAIGAATDGGWACGTGANRWSQVWAVNGTIQTSDRNQKYEIEYGLARFAPIFDLLKPCSYRLIGDNHDRVHMGLIAQDVEQAMTEVGIDSMDFSTLVIDRGRYAIRYTELIPLLIREVQNLKKEVAQWKKN